jgi:hypothetical protein
MTQSVQPEVARAAEARDGGVVRFLTFAESIRQRTALAAEQVAIVVGLERPGPSARGRLADVVDEAIERELAARGAAAPGIGSAEGRDATLSDQLFRARQVGAQALCVALGPLHAMCGPGGALEVEDGETLRFLAAATRERPVWLLIDEENAGIGTYTAVAPLASVLAAPEGRSLTVAARTTGSEGVATAGEARTVAAAVAAVEEVSPESPAAPAVHSAGAAIARPSDEWRHWALQLAAARGPQSLAAFERLFATCYVPLARAIDEGLEDPRARAAEAEFRRSFEKAYTDAFSTFAVTGKRPRMVFDAPEIAARIARLHGARTVQLLLVDSMRWDVGQLVKERLAHHLGNRASLTDELTLWAALPTTTARQLETLARGIEALKRLPEEPIVDPAVESLRGKSAEVVRRIKLGRRDLFKLDVLAAALRQLQLDSDDGTKPSRDLAEIVARTIARYSETLAPRTLLFVFGDHGYCSQNRQAREGGASPDEVIVPAFSFFVGPIH